MKRELRRWLGTDSSDRPAVEILPFAGAFPSVCNAKNSCREGVKWDFVYVADGVAHKNHRNLVAAWQLLSQNGFTPSLALTLGARDEPLAMEIMEIARTSNLRIHNVGQLSYADVFDLYRNSRALIFPSTTESFGLPLVEAASTGLPIIAGELDFVRDVCDPVETFDPSSPNSIARAALRFLGGSEARIPVRSPHEFWDNLIDGNATRFDES